MFDDFIVRAFAAGIGLAFITGPLGCFIVWRRLSYFGDTIAHSALLGVVIAYALDFNLIIAVFVVSCLLALSLLFLQRRTNLPDDALLGLLAHSVLAIGLVLLGILSFIRIDLMGLLFGDILSVNVTDLLFVWIGGSIVLIVLILIWRPLFAGTVNLELAKAEGLNPDLANAIFTLLIASVIAISIKIVGILLITGLLIIPASASRNLSSTPVQMAIISSIIGVASVVLGIQTSMIWNTPTGPTILTITLLAGLTVPMVVFAQSQPIVVLEYPNQSASGNLDSNNPFVIDANYTAKHKVLPNETLSHVIAKHYANSGLNLKFIEMAIVAANRKAFVRGNPNFLYADKTLHLPSLNEIQNMILGKNKVNAGSGGGSSQSDQIYFIGG